MDSLFEFLSCYFQQLQLMFINSNSGQKYVILAIFSLIPITLLIIVLHHILKP